MKPSKKDAFKNARESMEYLVRNGIHTSITVVFDDHYKGFFVVQIQPQSHVDHQQPTDRVVGVFHHLEYDGKL